MAGSTTDTVCGLPREQEPWMVLPLLFRLWERPTKAWGKVWQNWIHKSEEVM